MESKGSDDLDLLERIRRGDTGGAGELFERYAPALLRFTDRMLSDRASAEEVTQEVFVKVISRAHQYDGRAGVASWLFAIAANACRDRRRRDRRATVVPLEAVAEPRARGEGIESSIVSRQRRQAVRAGAVGALGRAARGPGPRPLPRHAVRRDRRDARDLGRSRQDPHLSGRRNAEGPFLGGGTHGLPRRNDDRPRPAGRRSGRGRAPGALRPSGGLRGLPARDGPSRGPLDGSRNGPGCDGHPRVPTALSRADRGGVPAPPGPRVPSAAALGAAFPPGRRDAGGRRRRVSDRSRASLELHGAARRRWPAPPPARSQRRRPAWRARRTPARPCPISRRARAFRTSPTARPMPTAASASSST